MLYTQNNDSYSHYQHLLIACCMQIGQSRKLFIAEFEAYGFIVHYKTCCSHFISSLQLYVSDPFWVTLSLEGVIHQVYITNLIMLACETSAICDTSRTEAGGWKQLWREAGVRDWGLASVWTSLQSVHWQQWSYGGLQTTWLHSRGCSEGECKQASAKQVPSKLTKPKNSGSHTHLLRKLHYYILHWCFWLLNLEACGCSCAASYLQCGMNIVTHYLSDLGSHQQGTCIVDISMPALVVRVILWTVCEETSIVTWVT